MEAERIWQDTETEEDNNRSIITRVASLERMETGSIIRRNSIIVGSPVFEFCGEKKCVLKVSETCSIKPEK